MHNPTMNTNGNQLWWGHEILYIFQIMWVKLKLFRIVFALFHEFISAEERWLFINEVTWGFELIPHAVSSHWSSAACHFPGCRIKQATSLGQPVTTAEITLQGKTIYSPTLRSKHKLRCHGESRHGSSLYWFGLKTWRGEKLEDRWKSFTCGKMSLEWLLKTPWRIIRNPLVSLKVNEMVWTCSCMHSKDMHSEDHPHTSRWCYLHCGNQTCRLGNEPQSC